MGPPYYWRAAICTAAVAASAFSQQQQQADRPAAPAASRHPSYDTVTVAKVGDRVLTGREFLLSYEFGPAFPKRGPDAKRRYLGFMINEKLLALDGYAMGLDRAPSARDMLQEIEGDLMTEQLYRRDVAPDVRITQAELAEGIRRERTGLKVKWLYDADEAGIMSAHSLIRSGTPFDSLFVAQLDDSVRLGDRSMTTTLLKLFRSNPALAAVVDTLRSGEVSLPIKAPDGWYLVAIEERSINAILTQSEDAKLREDVERALVQQRSDSLSDRYIDRMMRGRRPVIQRRTFDILEAHLIKKLLPPEKVMAWGVDERLRGRWGAVSSAAPVGELRDTLVTLHRRAFTIGDFLRWYQARDTFLKFRLHSPQAFFTSLEQLVWRMVRDKLLVERARQRGYDRLPEVQNYSRWWKDKLVYALRKNLLADSISMATAELQRYYEEHRRDYRNPDGSQMPYERALDDVRRDYYNDELTRRMLHRIGALKQRYGVTIHEANLGSLPVETEHNPAAIDVYAVKKGGTFPHRAFPSIDYEWQRWD